MNSGRDRDESVERLLQQSLAHGDSSARASNSDCPDAETLAAWVDGGLDKRAMALVEAHASECARCQALLAAVGRTAPDPSLPAWQETWLRGWGLRWLLPLAATAAAAVILWIVVPTGERPPDLPQQARAEPPKAAPTPPQPDEGKDRFSAQAVRPATPDAANETTAAKRENKAQEKKAVDVDAVSAKAAAAPPTVGGATAALPGPESSVARQSPLGRAGGAISIEIASPDPSVRWRIRGGGSVEHTTNGGTAWEAAPTGVDAVLTAGASPSPLVCWLIGRAGTVLLSTDGRTFRRVPFPEMTDLATVQATDAQTATVTTTGGRTFRTTDGGGTWAPLQGF